MRNRALESSPPHCNERKAYAAMKTQHSQKQTNKQTNKQKMTQLSSPAVAVLHPLGADLGCGPTVTSWYKVEAGGSFSSGVYH